MASVEPAGEQRVVLVVEPDEAIGELLSGTVGGQAGYQAMLVTNAALALAAIETVRLDLAIIDLDLPGLSGIELVDRLRALPSGPLPVLLLSDGSADQAAAMRERHIATFVQKPFDVDTLIQLMLRLAPPPHEEPA